MEEVIRLAQNVGVTEYPTYQSLPAHTGEKFGCGMPVQVDSETRKKIDELELSNGSPMGDESAENNEQEVVDTEAIGMLNLANVAAHELKERDIAKHSLPASLTDSTIAKRVKAHGKFIDYPPRFVMLPTSDEYLAIIGNLPKPVLPFTSLKEVNLLLSLLPKFISGGVRKSVRYADLTRAYNAYVLSSFNDVEYSFKSTNYIRECAERLFRVSLVQQATETGSIILSTEEQNELRKKFRAPLPTAPGTDRKPLHCTAVPRTEAGLQPRIVIRTATPLHYANGAVPCGDRVQPLARQQSGSEILIAPAPLPSHNARVPAVLPLPTVPKDICSVCRKPRFPEITAPAGFRHRKDGYCEESNAFSSRSAVGKQIRNFKKTIASGSPDEMLFEKIRSKFPESKRPDTFEYL